ncbi:TetR/AcrR family transcriptional regulator [Kribbella pratensis]|uniref:TetR family transcriptional regulator n=1 Tax=Kribbella pratensis TaxID=2512112 RepID=A0A4R8CKT2_9ACTN|nr:TetR/AcrR family transcriptional regulator [Kribbella pratensis]TDW76609.1 TetR family transcriptional regulator [Kribbella pratensis]
MGGLRERKKAETRARIADVALRLFAERGFDQTTVAEVAAAADVSVKTVFNYYPAKEDLFFDRAEEIEQSWLEAVADRQEGESLLAGLRRRSLGRFADHPNGPSTHFRRVLAGSPLLQAKGQQMWAWHEDAVAAALAEEVDELTARILAHQVFNIHPLALRMVERWTEEGLEADEIRERVLALVNRAFDLLDRSVGVGGAV